MALWHIMLGMGFALVATIFTVISSQQQHRVISNTTKSAFLSLPADDCPLCLSPMTNNMVYLNCGHAFHQQCLKKLRKHQDNCPLCRTKIVP
ncbi:uncharacterized protein ACRADG_004990 [Cochliomyia hominivorax]